MKCFTTALVMIMLLIASQDSLAEGTWITFPEKYVFPNRLAVAPNGDVWISWGELWRYDGETWTSFTEEGGFNDNTVFSITCSTQGDVWFGTKNGVTRYDGETWTTFDEDDGLPVDDFGIHSIAVTPGGIVWVSIPTVGVSRYDGETWTTFTTADGLSDRYVESIAVLSDDIVLFGNKLYGISIYHGENWSNITAAKDGLISDSVTSIAIAPDGTIWVGTKPGVSKYDGDTWISYTVDDGLADYNISSIAAGSDGLVWVGTPSGLSCYDGKTWTTLTTDDGLGDNRIGSLAVGPDNTVWIGHAGGLQHYIPDTGTFVKETDLLPEEIEIISNYPNPFNPETTIEFTLPSESAVDLSIYSITGQKVRTLVSRPMTAGTHSVRWAGISDSGHALSSGVYIARIVMGNKVSARSMMLMK